LFLLSLLRKVLATEAKRMNVKDVQSRKQSDLEWSRVTLEWKEVNNKSGGTTLASAHALCFDLLSYAWLHISEGLNYCQEFRRGVV